VISEDKQDNIALPDLQRISCGWANDPESQASRSRDSRPLPMLNLPLTHSIANSHTRFLNGLPEASSCRRSSESDRLSVSFWTLPEN